MRILHVASSVELETGGPIEGIRQCARVLNELGHSVQIVTLDAPSVPEVASLGIPVAAMGPSSGRYGYSPRLTPWLNSHMAEFDMVVVNGLWQYHGWAVHQVARKISKPYFIFTHGMLDPWFNRTYPLKRLKKLGYWPWQHAVLRDARAVLFTAEEERLLARESFRPYNIVERVVAYGTSTPPPRSESQPAAFFDRVPQVRDRPFILFLGRIHEKKGLDLLIQAFAQVFGGDPTWALVAAGPDQTNCRPALEELASKLGVSDRILWPGMIKDDVKWGAFRSATAFALPSHQENFGIAVAEALACGTPVLMSNKINIWREVASTESGFVADDTLAGTIELLQRIRSTSPEERAAMGSRAVKCFETHFEARSMATGLLDLYQELGRS